MTAAEVKATHWYRDREKLVAIQSYALLSAIHGERAMFSRPQKVVTSVEGLMKRVFEKLVEFSEFRVDCLSFFRICILQLLRSDFRRHMNK